MASERDALQLKERQSVTPETIKGSALAHGARDFEQRLSVLIRLLHEAVFHRPNAFFGCGECTRKIRSNIRPADCQCLDE